MKLTIIPSDKVVGIDRVFRQVDMTGVDPLIHAVQFDTVKGIGEIEYEDKPNERITDLSAFQFLRDRWAAAAPLPPPPPTQAELDEQARLRAIRDDALRQQLITQLSTATNSQIGTFVDNQVTDLASAKTMLKRILLVLALIAR